MDEAETRGDSDRGDAAGANPSPAGAGPAAAGGRDAAELDHGSDPLLRGCRTAVVDGRRRPVLGGIPLLRRIGGGGMGVVYYGIHPRLSVPVAVKILPQSHDAALVERFRREAQLAATLRSEHIVAVLDVDRDPDTGGHYIVMEYVDGTSAGAWARRSPACRASERDALTVCVAATKGLAAAHEAGVLHRDVKPENLLIPHGSDGGCALARTKLADLGLARGDGTVPGLTQDFVAIGTPGYIAPEQIRDARTAGKPADVYGMGATLYALLAGAPPHDGSTPMKVFLAAVNERPEPLSRRRPDVSVATQRLVERCLSADPTERPADATALLGALEACLRGLPRPAAEASPTAAPSRAPRPGLRRAAAAVAVLLAVGAWFAFGRRGSDADPSLPGLSVESRPPGATILVDGVERGRAPLLLTDLADGLHTIVGVLPGHDDATYPDVLTNMTQLRAIQLDLAPHAGFLDLTGHVPGTRLAQYRPGEREPFANLAADGPVVRAAAGQWRIVASCPGFESVEFAAVEIARGAHVPLPLPFAERAGTIDLGKFPDAVTFLVDGAVAHGAVLVQAGERSVVARRRGFRDQTARVVVAAGGSARPELFEWVPERAEFVVSGAGAVAVLGAGDGVAAEKHPVTLRAPGGDVIELEPGASVKVLGRRDGACDVRLGQGTASVRLTTATRLLVGRFALRCASADPVRALVQFSTEPGTEVLLRAIDGTIAATSDPHRVTLGAGQAVTLSSESEAGPPLTARTGQGNPEFVDVRTSVEGGEVVVRVPRSTTTNWSAPGGGKLRVGNDINSLRTGKIAIHTQFVGRPANDAQIGPGTFAVIAAVVFDVSGAAPAPSTLELATGAPRARSAASDAVGDEPLPGVVRIADIERAADGGVTYVVANVSGKLQEELSWSVEFVFPSAGPSQRGPGIQVPADTVATRTSDLVLLKADSGKRLTCRRPEARADLPIATRLVVTEDDPLSLVAREGTTAGTVFLAGALECVGFSAPETLAPADASGWIEFENVSKGPVSEIEVRLLFDSAGAERVRSKWVAAPDVRPGERCRVTLDLKGLGELRRSVLRARVRQQSL